MDIGIFTDSLVDMLGNAYTPAADGFGSYGAGSSNTFGVSIDADPVPMTIGAIVFGGGLIGSKLAYGIWGTLICLGIAGIGAVVFTSGLGLSL